jgi:hypothetical protein
MDADPLVSVESSTLSALAAAEHLTVMDAGAVQALLALARKIDAWDTIVDWALDDVADAEGKSRPAVPQNDNVSLSAYLKYCDQLGLSPAGRKALQLKQEAESGKKAKLTALRSTKAAG